MAWMRVAVLLLGATLSLAVPEPQTFFQTVQRFSSERDDFSDERFGNRDDSLELNLRSNEGNLVSYFDRGRKPYTDRIGQPVVPSVRALTPASQKRLVTRRRLTQRRKYPNRTTIRSNYLPPTTHPDPLSTESDEIDSDEEVEDSSASQATSIRKNNLNLVTPQQQQRKDLINVGKPSSSTKNTRESVMAMERKVATTIRELDNDSSGESIEIDDENDGSLESSIDDDNNSDNDESKENEDNDDNKDNNDDSKENEDNNSNENEDDDNSNENEDDDNSNENEDDDNSNENGDDDNSNENGDDDNTNENEDDDNDDIDDNTEDENDDADDSQELDDDSRELEDSLELDDNLDDISDSSEEEKVHSEEESSENENNETVRFIETNEGSVNVQSNSEVISDVTTDVDDSREDSDENKQNIAYVSSPGAPEFARSEPNFIPVYVPSIITQETTPKTQHDSDGSYPLFRAFSPRPKTPFTGVMRGRFTSANINGQNFDFSDHDFDSILLDGVIHDIELLKHSPLTFQNDHNYPYLQQIPYRHQLTINEPISLLTDRNSLEDFDDSFEDDSSETLFFPGTPSLPPQRIAPTILRAPLAQQSLQLQQQDFDDSDEITIIQQNPVIPPPSPSYLPPAPVCKPIVQYSVVTHQLFVPGTKEVVRTQYLPSTVYSTIVETKFYLQPQVDVVTVTSVPTPDLLTKTELVRNPVYVPQTQYETNTKYVTATQIQQITHTQFDVQTQYSTVTSYAYRTQVQYRTKTNYLTNVVTQTELAYQTKTKYKRRDVVHTVTEKVPVVQTVVQTKLRPQYLTVTESVPIIQTFVQTKYNQQLVTKTVTSQYPFYSTLLSTVYQPQYVTKTVQGPCIRPGYY